MSRLWTVVSTAAFTLSFLCLALPTLILWAAIGQSARLAGVILEVSGVNVDSYP